MRYYLDELAFNGSVIRGIGWGAPEDLGDRLIVTLTDESGTLLSIPVGMMARPDVVGTIYGVPDRSEDYGFSFSFPPEDRTYVYIEFRAEQLEIDRARKRIEVKDLVSAYKREHSLIGKIEKKKKEREARREQKRALKKR